MAFPAAPLVGDLYTTPAGSIYQYTADGAWKLNTASFGGSGGTTLPANALGTLNNNGSGTLSWSGSRPPTTAAAAALAAPSAGLGANGDVAISGQTTDGKTVALYNKIGGVWTQADIRGPNGGSVFTTASATMLAPAAGVGLDGDMALSYNAAGTQYKSYNKVAGAWVQSSLLGVTGGTTLSITDNSLAAPAGGVGFDGDTAVVSNTAGSASKVFTKRAGAWVASSFAPGTGGETYEIVDNTLSAPSAALGADGDGAIISNTAGTTSKFFVKRSGTWVVSSLGGLTDAAASGNVVATTGWLFPNGIPSGMQGMCRTGEDPGHGHSVSIEYTTNLGVSWIGLASMGGLGIHPAAGGDQTVFICPSKTSATICDVTTMPRNSAARQQSFAVPVLPATANGVRVMHSSGVIGRGVHFSF